jgi:hypothetical protein
MVELFKTIKPYLVSTKKINKTLLSNYNSLIIVFIKYQANGRVHALARAALISQYFLYNH